MDQGREDCGAESFAERLVAGLRAVEDGVGGVYQEVIVDETCLVGSVWGEGGGVVGQEGEDFTGDGELAGSGEAVQLDYWEGFGGLESWGGHGCSCGLRDGFCPRVLCV